MSSGIEVSTMTVPMSMAQEIARCPLDKGPCLTAWREQGSPIIVYQHGTNREAALEIDAFAMNTSDIAPLVRQWLVRVHEYEREDVKL